VGSPKGGPPSIVKKGGPLRGVPQRVSNIWVSYKGFSQGGSNKGVTQGGSHKEGPQSVPPRGSPKVVPKCG
jgi:hypothetical protein